MHLEPEIGSSHLVSCLYIPLPTPSDEYRYVPIHLPIHSDDELGNPVEHAHIDLRFYTDSELAKFTYEKSMYDCYIRTVNGEDFESSVFRFCSPALSITFMKQHNIDISIHMVSKVCCRKLRLHKNFRTSDYFSLLRNRLKQSNAKLNLKNPKCLHHGTDLKDFKPIDGCLTCPLHGLKYNMETGCVI